MAVTVNLFEHVKYSLKNSEEFRGIISKDKFSDDLENVLERIWKDRNRFIPAENLYYKSASEKQRYIDFRKNDIVPRNWIGTIHFRGSEEEYVINLLPKVFYRENHSYSSDELNCIYVHILWWLSGSKKQNYSSLESSLGALASDFLEVMVYIFSAYTLEIFSINAYHYYNTVEEELETVRGQIDFTAYINNYGRGNRHIIPCIYDSFQYDNQFNRIVKYVAGMLREFTRNPGTKKNLDELLFILDEVETCSVTVEDCDKVILNPIYTEFKTILDNCRLFLSSLSVYKWKDDYNVFALLIPAEKLFENFIFSILKNNSVPPVKRISRTRPDTSRTFLVRQLPAMEANRYQMINDIVVSLQDGSHILIDTKYKKIYNTAGEEEEELDTVYNISQADVYQMVSYAVGSGISEISLIYPALLGEVQSRELPVYEIDDDFTQNTAISIHPFKVDIIHKDGLSMKVNGRLEEIFEETKELLVKQLMNSVLKIRDKSYARASGKL